MEISEDDYKKLIAYNIVLMKKVTEIENALRRNPSFSTNAQRLLDDLDFEAYKIRNEFRLPKKED